MMPTRTHNIARPVCMRTGVPAREKTQTKMRVKLVNKDYDTFILCTLSLVRVDIFLYISFVAPLHDARV